MTTSRLHHYPAGIALLGALAAAAVAGFLAADDPPLGGRLVGGLAVLSLLAVAASQVVGPRSSVIKNAKLPIVCVVAIVEVASGDLIGSIHVGGFGTGDISVYLTVALASLVAVLLPLEIGRVIRPGFFRRVPIALLVFLAWAFLITAVYGFNSAAIQNLSCYFILVGGIAVTVVMAPGIGAALKFLDILVIVGWARAALYAFALATHGFGAASVTGARSFAIGALILMAAVIPSPNPSLWTRALPYVLWIEIVASGSRTAMAAGALMLVFVTVRNPRGGRILRVSGALIILVVASWYAIGHVRPLHDRFFGGDNLGRNSVGVNTEGRRSIWPTVIRAAEVHPWTGSGAGTATNTVRSDPVIASAGEPHNDYLRLWTDFGFIGLGLWLIGLAVLFARLGRRAVATVTSEATIHYAALLAVASLSVVAITDNVLIYHFAVAPLAVMVGLSLAQDLPVRHIRRASYPNTYDSG